MNERDKKANKQELTRLSVSGFKSIYNKVDIDIARITVLAGANSSGKSTFMQPFLMLKQTEESQYDPGGLVISGPNVKFTEVLQVLPRRSNSKSADLILTFVYGGAEYVRCTYRIRPGHRIRVTRIKIRKNGITTIIKDKLDDSEYIKVFTDMPYLFDMIETIKEGKKIKSKKNVSEEEKLRVARNFLKVVRDRSFMFLDLETENKGFGFRISAMPNISRSLKDLIHIPGLRGNPERSYRISANANQHSGIFSDYTASIVDHWIKTKDPRVRKVGDDLRALGLTWKVDSRGIDETRSELRVGRLPMPQQGGAFDLVNIADVGFGVSQVLPVVVGLEAASPGQIVYIEQPELHLHPKAQIRLAELIGEAGRRGVKTIIETHSSVMILTFQRMIADGILSKEDLSLNWFTRNEITGETVAVKANLDEVGGFGEWPADFSEVEFELQSLYLDAVERHQKVSQ